MTNSTNWPNPERPGIPLFPENNGKHILIDKESGNELSAEWNSADEEWLLPNGWLSAKNAAKNYAYAECVSVELTPTQIAELLAGERERCAKLLEDAYEKTGKDFEYLGCLSCANEIRNLGAAP